MESHLPNILAEVVYLQYYTEAVVVYYLPYSPAEAVFPLAKILAVVVRLLYYT